MLQKDVSKQIVDILQKTCKRYFQEHCPDKALPENIEISLLPTRDSRHGDFTSNISMRLAKVAGSPPQKIAKSFEEIIQSGLQEVKNVAKVTAEGGYINFWISDQYYHDIIKDVYSQKERFGTSTIGSGERINLEFVSANPTGPLTIAHGRQAAIGEALSRILRFTGFEVTSEYYLNDFGRQIDLLGKSVEVRYRNLFDEDVSIPEGGYMGDYIIDIAREIRSKKNKSLLNKSSENEAFFRDYAVEYMMGLIRKDLADFGVSFDVWTSQRDIEKQNAVAEGLKKLEDAGYIYEKEGAKWFASTRLGDDKDRVVIKSDGSYTYLAPDIAYHLDKYRRGYSRLVDLLGPDHHGYIRRMKAAVQALGHDKDALDILIVQLVTLLRGGETVSMSTRQGSFISLREIMDDIGTDVTRFFFLSRRLDSHLDFDIDLAKKESADNPVFYIQYAHARICSIKKYSRKNCLRLFFQKTQLELLTDKPEKQLMRKLSEFPSAVTSSAESLEPNRLIAHLNELARCFHSFYTECRVISDDAARSKARLFLVECVRIVLANGLKLLNITFPEKM